MPSSSYRLVKTTSVLVTKNGHRELLTLPVGSIITVEESASQESPLVSVRVDGIAARMFTVDLERRAELEGVQK